MEADTHLSRASGPGCALRRAGGRGGDVFRLAGRGGEVGDRDDLGHLLYPRVRGIALASVPAVLRAHRDALAVGLHHDHVAGRAAARAAGPLLVEVIGPGGQVRSKAGELRAADCDPGPVPDCLLGLPVPSAGQVAGGQGAHPQRVRVVGQHPPGIGRVQVRLAAVAVGQPRRPDRPEHAHHAPVVPLLHAAVPDPGRAADLRDTHLACAVDGEGGLQQLPLQLPPGLADHRLPLPVVRAGRVLRGPGDHLREPLRRPGQRRRQLAVQGTLAAVLAHPRHRHRDRNRHRRACVTCWGFMGSIQPHNPSPGPGNSGPGSGPPLSTPCRQPGLAATDQRRSPSAMSGTSATTPTLPYPGGLKRKSEQDHAP